MACSRPIEVVCDGSPRGVLKEATCSRPIRDDMNLARGFAELAQGAAGVLVEVWSRSRKLTRRPVVTSVGSR